MALIKGHNAASLLKDAVVLDLGDLNRQAQQMRAAAESAARQIVTDAQAEARRLTAGAHDQGLHQGRAEGLAEGRAQGLAEGGAKGHAEALAASRAQLQKLHDAWLAALTQWDAQRQDVERQARQAILELALRLAHKVTHRTVQVDSGVVIDQVGAALSQVLRPQDVVVRICPEDRPVLGEALPHVLAQFPRLQHVQIADDPAVSRGGCLVTYGQALIDATIETQLRRITELLLPEAPLPHPREGDARKGGPPSALSGAGEGEAPKLT